MIRSPSGCCLLIRSSMAWSNESSLLDRILIRKSMYLLEDKERDRDTRFSEGGWESLRVEILTLKFPGVEGEGGD